MTSPSTESSALDVKEVLTLWSRRSLGSNLKHFWLACAGSPVYKNAPATMRAELDGLIWTASLQGSRMSAGPVRCRRSKTLNGYAWADSAAASARPPAG